jgi:hypothetical protein
MWDWLRSMVGTRAASPVALTAVEPPSEKSAVKEASVSTLTRAEPTIDYRLSRAQKLVAPPEKLNGKSGAQSEQRLDASSPTELSNSLKSLAASERGWISYKEAAHWFSADDADEWEPGRDEPAMREIGAFATERQASVSSDKAQRRIYFTRQ